MTTNEVNLLITLFYTQYKGKRLCDVIQDCQNRDVISDMRKYSHNNTLIITQEDGCVVIGYDLLIDSCYYPSLGCKFFNRCIKVNLLDYISFKDLV